MIWYALCFCFCFYVALCYAYMAGHLLAEWHNLKPREDWTRENWLTVYAAPYTLPRHVVRTLRLAWYSRFIQPPPRCAVYAREGDDRHSPMVEPVQDGDWFTSTENGRAYRVNRVWWSDCFFWCASLRDVDGYVHDIGFDEPHMRRIHEYRTMTSFQVRDGEWVPYSPPEIASLMSEINSRQEVS